MISSFGDDGTVGTCAACYGSSYSEWLGFITCIGVKFSYERTGQYIPTITISNAVSTKTQILGHTIYIRIPLDECIVITSPQIVQKPPAIAKVKLNVKPGMDCNGMVDICFKYITVGIFYCSNVTVNTLLNVTILVPMESLPIGDLNIDVMLDNIVSKQLLRFNTSIEQEVTNVDLALLEDVIKIGDEAHFMISVSQGNYKTHIDFGDGTKKKTSMMDASSFNLSKIYETDGVFNVKLNLSNSFSWAADQVNITVKPMIGHVRITGEEHIAIGHTVKYTAQGTQNMTGVTYFWKIIGKNYDLSNTTVDVPGINFACPALGLFHIFLQVNNEISSANTSRNVLCSEMLNGVKFEITLFDGMILINDTIKVFKGTDIPLNASITSDNSHISFTWNISGCGYSLIETKSNDSNLILTDLSPCIYDITLTVSNLVGFEKKTTKLDVMERIQFGDLTLLTPAVSIDKVKFSIGLKRDGTRPCYSFNFGDGIITQYAGSGCLQDTILNQDFIVHPDSIAFSHDYEYPGIYPLTITGGNDMSNDKIVTAIAVNLARCNPVVTKILGSGQEKSNPRIEYKSRKSSVYSSIEVRVIYHVLMV